MSNFASSPGTVPISLFFDTSTVIFDEGSDETKKFDEIVPVKRFPDKSNAINSVFDANVGRVPVNILFSNRSVLSFRFLEKFGIAPLSLLLEELNETSSFNSCSSVVKVP